MIHIIGGAKTGYNLYSVLRKHQIDSVVYYFDGEYGAIKEGGMHFDSEWPGANSTIKRGHRIIVSSESAFARLPVELQDSLDSHYFFRNKNNITEVASEIATYSVPFITKNVIDHETLPIIFKRSSADTGKVPFKVRIVKTDRDLEATQRFRNDCFVQPYFSPKCFEQIAVAGFFTGKVASLITVKQLNQYPIGVSSYVRQFVSQQTEELKENITAYLKNRNYRGFIEFEFMKDRANNNIFLMDINPRPWGWFFYYVSAIPNLKNVILFGDSPVLHLKAAWVNVPRLVLSFAHRRLSHPHIKDLFTGNICYEPM